MHRLAIHLLGPPFIRWGNQTITIRRQKPRALLFYLAAQGGMVGREELIDIFWQNLPASNSRKRFTETLSRLRKNLPEPDIIIKYGRLIGLDPAKVFVDLQEFENLVDQAGQLPWKIPRSEPLPEETFQQLQGAVAQWHGSKFLQGKSLPGTVDLDDWLCQTTSRLEHLRLRILDRLSDHFFAVGDLDASLELARRALESDPTNENLHYRVMQVLIEMGELQQAVQHFETTEKLIQKELGVTPSPQLIALYKKVRRLRTAKPLVTPPKWELHKSVQAPFVGRGEAFAQLRHWLNQHIGVVILGESGQGKTRFIQEYTSQLHPQPRLLVATCRPLETNLPYHPICDLFRRHITPDEWLSLSSVWAGQLIRLLPELKTMRPDLDPPTTFEDPGQAQTILFEAIRQVFEQLHESHQLFVVIDDAHWADEATLATLLYLATHPPFDQSASLVVLARQEEISPRLNDFLTAWEQSKQGAVFYLTSLKRQDITDITRFIFQGVPSEEFITDLEKGTGGNPLFILETLRTILTSDPAPDISSLTSIPLPESLRNLIRARLQKLQNPTRRILETAAVIGSEFTPQIISRVSKHSDAAIIQALEELERFLVIQPKGDTSVDATYHFTHDKFREGILTDMSIARLQALHRQTAKVLKSQAHPAHPAILAYHYSQAGEWVEAYDAWVKAGNQARASLSLADATRSFLSAEEILKRIEYELSDEQIYRLYAPWSEMACDTQDTDVVRRLGNELLSHGEKRNSPLLLGTAYDVLSDACMTENRFEEGLNLATQAIPHLAKAGNNFEHMEAYIHRGVFLYMLNRPVEAIEAFEDALALATDNPSADVLRARSNAHYQMSLLRTMVGYPTRGKEHALLSLQDAKASQRTYLEAAAYFVLSVACYFLGEYQQAREHLTKGIDIAERIHGWRMLGYLRGYAAATELILGNTDTAYQNAREAIGIGEKYKLDDVKALGCRMIGDLYMLLHNPAQSIISYMQGVEAVGEHFLGLENLLRLGYVRYLNGEREAGLQTIEFMRLACENSQLGMGVILSQYFQVLCYLYSQDWDQLRELATTVKTETDQRSLLSYHLSSINILGKVDYHDGRIDSAIEKLTFTAKESRRLGNVWLELDSLVALDSISRKQGQADKTLAKRIRELLTYLRSHTTQDELRDTFSAFRQRYAQFI